MNYEEKIGREVFTIELFPNKFINSELLIYKILLSIYRSLNKQVFDLDTSEFIKFKSFESGLIKRIPLKTIGIYWNPNMIDARDLIIGTHRYTNDVIYKLISGEKIENINLIEKILTLSHMSKYSYTKKYLSNIFLVDVDIKQTEPFGFNISKVYKHLKDIVEDKFELDLDKSLIYILNTGGGYHILFKTDEQNRKKLGKILNKEIKHVLGNLINESGIENFEIEVKYSNFLSPVPGTMKNGLMCYIEYSNNK